MGAPPDVARKKALILGPHFVWIATIFGAFCKHFPKLLWNMIDSGRLGYGKVA